MNSEPASGNSQDERSVLEAEISRSSTENAELRLVIDALKSSTSWRVTAPLRWMVHVIRGRASLPVTALGNALRRLYLAIPASMATKIAVKRWLFLRLPLVFSRSEAYRNWERFESRNRAAESLWAFSRSDPPASPSPVSSFSHAVAPPSSDAQSDSQGNAKPRPADGLWEWQEYDALRRRLVAKAFEARDQFKPDPLAIQDIDPGHIPHLIQQLCFPARPSSPIVTVLVPSFQNVKYTLECLKSIIDAAPSVDYEVLVADDASTDGTAAHLAEVPNLVVLTSAENRHFLLNVNHALSEVRGRFLLLLNNDVQLRAGAIDALLTVIQSAPDIGAVGPKLLYPSGHLQEAGCSFRADCSTEMIGLGESPDLPAYQFTRDVDYCSGACLLLETRVFKELGGFDERFAPAYFEDADLCLRLRERGLRTVYCPDAVAVHHLSKSTASSGEESKLALVARNLGRFTAKWQETISELSQVRTIAFYLPQFHPIPENDRWWGKGFTEWRNVARAKPNFVGHYQPRIPADLGFYDLRLQHVIEDQVGLARRYGISGFCFYYYWFAGKRLLEMPVERILATGSPEFPYCLCWANENWTRRWDGRETDVLMAQAHSEEDDHAVILDLLRHFRSAQYIRVRGRPLLLVYRVGLFPDFKKTAETWRHVCREQGIGEIYLALVESFDMVFDSVPPENFGCDAAVEFPPHGMAEARTPSGAVTNTDFTGTVADYRDLAAAFCARPSVPYVRFRTVMPGWDNTARRQDQSYCFENATPGAFEAWTEFVVEQTRRLLSGDEKIVFINAWNEWAEGAYLEPDTRFGHAFLEAVRNGCDAGDLKRRERYALR